MKKGSKASDETRAKMSKAHQGKKRGPMSIEQRKKLSIARTGTKLSPETRAKQSESHKGNKSFTGKHLSASHRANVSKALRGKPKSQHMKDALRDYRENREPEEVKEARRQRTIESNKARKGEKLSDRARYNVMMGTLFNPDGTEKDRYISEPERHINEYLSKYFEVISQYLIPKIKYPHPYDMLVKLTNGIDLLLEFDGQFWHSPKNPGWDPKKDQLRSELAEKYGYKFLVIREEDYRKKGNLKFVKSQIAKFMPEFANMHLNN